MSADSSHPDTLVGAIDAEAQFARLLDRVEAGESITIIRHGKAVATLAPPPAAERTANLPALLEAVRARRLAMGPATGSAQALIEDGRRY